jgi:AcrR family transcriptional regulator
LATGICYHWKQKWVIIEVMTKVRDATSSEASSARDDVRARIVSAAIALLASGGRDAVTTRAVADAAGVQAPTIYRLFGDKSGLLDAVAEHGFAAYLKEKKNTVDELGTDPVANLRVGWDLHIGFGLANPALFSLMYGDPRPGVKPPAAAVAHNILKQRIRQLAVAGRLRVSEDRAADLVRASGCGTVLTLLAMPEDRRDLGLSETAREAVIAAITTGSPALESPGPAAAAIALRAVLPEATILTQGERRLLDEWLDRLAANRPS